MAMHASVADLRDLLRDSDIPLDDGSAVLMLELASAAVNGHCHRRFEFVEDDEITLSGSWDTLLRLPETPVIDVSAISLADVALETDGYTWNRRGAVYLGPPFAISEVTQGRGSWGGPLVDIAVTYSHGYEVVPDAVKLATLELAAEMWHQKGAAGAIQSETIGDYSYTLDTSKESRLASAVNLLKPYVRRAYSTVI